MTPDIVVSTPRRIPIINFSDDADYDSIGTLLNLIHGVVFQVEVDNSDILNGKVVNGYYTGTINVNGDDTITVLIQDPDTGDCGPKNMTIHFDEIISFTYL